MCSDRHRLHTPHTPPPDISVILPVHNGGDTLMRAITSVASQQLPPTVTAELIIVDDASTDLTPAIIARASRLFAHTSCSLRTITHPTRLGSSAAQRTGMHAARGHWLARIDSDDAYPPRFLAALHSAATRHAAHIACAPVDYLDHRGHTLRTIPVPRALRRAATSGHHLLDRLPVDTVTFALWNKLISRPWLMAHHIHGPLPGIDCWDDLSLMARAYALAPRIATHPSNPPYRYTSTPSLRSLSRHTAHSPHSRRILHDRLRCAATLTRLLAPGHRRFTRRLRLIAKSRYLRGPRKDIAAWRATFAEVNSPLAILATRHIHPLARLAMAAAAILPPALTQAVADTIDRLTPRRP